MDQAKLGFKRNQRWHRNKFCRPTYIWKVRQFIAQDRTIRQAAAKIGKDIFLHRWNLPTWPYVNPLQDMQADALEVEKRLTSPRRSSAKRGIEYIDLITEVVADNELAITKAIEGAKRIQKNTGQAVDFHELLFINNAAPIKTTAAEPTPVDANGKPVKQPAIPGQPPPMPAGQPAPPAKSKGEEDDDGEQEDPEDREDEEDEQDEDD